LYYELVRKGLMRRVTSEDEIKAAIFNPPETTRAFFRGRAVARFNNEISSIQWDEIVFSKGAYSHRVPLPEAAMDARLDALNHAARNGKDFPEFMSTLAQIG
jgi:proteasome accessory factor A